MTKQCDPCIISIANLKVNFTKKSAYYTRVYTVSPFATPEVRQRVLLIGRHHIHTIVKVTLYIGKGFSLNDVFVLVIIS